MPQYTPRKQAIEGVRRLQRPEGIGKAQWRGVRRYLFVIAGYYPKPYPSQERLAQELECDVRSIQRYQKLATEHGLLQVTADAGRKGCNATWSKTNLYRLVDPLKLSGVIPDNSSAKAPSGHYVPLRLDASLSSSPRKRTQPGPPSAGSNVIQMGRRQEPSSQVPRKAPAPRPSAGDLLTPGANRRQPNRVPARKQRWQVLAEYFADGWRDLIAHPDNRDLRDVRDVENQAQCRSYINSRFKDYTDSQVLAYMDEFFRLVSQRHVRVKDGQSAWLCFTGAWGRKRAINTSNPTAQTYVPPQWRAQ